MRRALLGVGLLVLAGCGGSSTPGVPTIAPARTYAVTGFTPAGVIAAGRPVSISFSIRQPDGTPLTAFKQGSGPHTGVHLIFVRRDLSTVIHLHPALDGSATITATATFPEPGPYRLVIDVFPAAGPQSNFQLFRELTVAGTYAPVAAPAPTATVTAGGYRFTLTGASHLRAVKAALVSVAVTGLDGRPATPTPWFGALAHAIFFRQGTLDYFHTHVCAPDVSGCTSVLGAGGASGRPTTPGRIDLGVLIPVAGTWRLFLELVLGGRLVTAPFTLVVR
ncbi:MAG: hypothetical protein WCH31_01465 [Actinomycetes bacterium]